MLATQFLARQVRKVQRLKFMGELAEYWDKTGSPLTRIPVLSGKELDLHLLYLHVNSVGGFEAACEQRSASSQFAHD